MTKETSYKKAIELKGILYRDIAYQEDVLENAGECYDGHSKDLADAKTLLNAVDFYIDSVERERD